MSENGTTDPEGEGDWGSTTRDPRQQEDAERNLLDPSATDDEPWSPPDRQPRGAELIGAETGEGENLSQRVMQEEREEEVDADVEQEMVGGDDPDAIPADQDVLGGPAGSDETFSAESPEQSAMRVVEGDEPL